MKMDAGVRDDGKRSRKDEYVYVFRKVRKEEACARRDYNISF